MGSLFSGELFQIEAGESTWYFHSSQRPGFEIGPLTCHIRLNGEIHYPDVLRIGRLDSEDGLRMVWVFNQEALN